MQTMRLYDLPQRVTRSPAVSAMRREIEIRDFRWFDAITINPDFLRSATDWEKAGNAWTMLVDDIPVAAAGYVDQTVGVGDIWGLFEKMREQSLRVKYAFHLEVTRRLDALTFRRLQILVDKDDSCAVHWAVRLGFLCETPDYMKEFIEGKKMQLWARVR